MLVQYVSDTVENLNENVTQIDDAVEQSLADDLYRLSQCT